MGEAFNEEGTLHAGNAFLDGFKLESLSEKLAWVKPDAQWASETSGHLGQEC